MWYSKISVFQVTSPCPTFQSLTDALTNQPAHDCPKQQWQQLGWTSPYPDSVGMDAFVHAHHQYLACQTCLSERLLPSFIIQQHTQEAIADFLAQHGEPPTNQEKKKLKAQVIDQLLPRAFIKKTYCPLYFDTQKKLLVIASTSSHTIEQVIALLRHSLGGLALEPLSFKAPLAECMTAWLKEEKPPVPLTIGARCIIADLPEQRAQCTFKGQEIIHPYVLNHLEQQKKVTELALEWPDRLSFILKANGHISSIKCLDGIQNHMEGLELDEAEAYFRASFMLMTDVLNELITILAQGCGGYKSNLLPNE